MINAFTIDIEEWFCSHNLNKTIQFDTWDNRESRIISNTIYLLDLLSKHNIKATFFVLGWIAERYPDLIKEIEHCGHEVGTHGYSHQLITTLEPDTFRKDLAKSLEVICKLIQRPVLGFRAPAFSVTKKTMWSTKIIKDLGLKYDSSVYPISHHPDYGIPDSPLEPFRFENGLVEIPMSCVTYGKTRIPCSGGAYFRIFPYWLFKRLVKQLHQQKRLLIFYIHPWELDPETPRVKLPKIAAFRHYTKLNRTRPKLEILLKDFKFSSLSSIYGQSMGIIS